MERAVFVCNKASLVKGRWTPQADGGIPTSLAELPVTPVNN